VGETKPEEILQAAEEQNPRKPPGCLQTKPEDKPPGCWGTKPEETSRLLGNPRKPSRLLANKTRGNLQAARKQNLRISLQAAGEQNPRKTSRLPGAAVSGRSGATRQ